MADVYTHPKFRKRAARIGAAVLVLHFLIVGIYQLPGAWFPYSFNAVTYHYMVPMFHQNWALFAPEPPKTNDRLLARYQSPEGQWSDWFDPGAEILETHQQQRFTYHGKLYNIYEAIGRNLHRDYWYVYSHPQHEALPEQQRIAVVDATMPRMESYTLAVAYVQNCLELQRPKEEIAAIEFAYERRRVPGSGEAIDGTEKPERYVFPPFTIAR